MGGLKTPHKYQRPAEWINTSPINDNDEINYLNATSRNSNYNINDSSNHNKMQLYVKFSDRQEEAQMRMKWLPW